jgi:hypothetical protein
MVAMALLLSLLAWFMVPGLQRETPSTNDLLTLDGARPILDNEHATVWDFTWTKGVPTGMERRTSDSVWIWVAPSAGTVVFWQKGAERRAAQSAGAPARAIVIDLKDHPASAMVNTSGFPNAFPRPGGKKAFENDHILVWDYTWTPGQPTPMHFHDKDVVVVYLKDGALKSTTPDGKSVVNQLSVGKTTFNARDRVHTETLVEGQSRAIITEFK